MVAETDARRRVRGAGMTSNTQNSATPYHSDTRQYLSSRNKAFGQNQYNFVKTGDPLKKPGSAHTESNLYAPAGKPLCKKYFLPLATSFQYQWTTAGMTLAEPALTTVRLPSGDYDIQDVLQILRSTMTANGHYYIHSATDTKIFLLTIVGGSHSLQLQSFLTNAAIFPDAAYVKNLAIAGTPVTPLESATYAPFFVIPATLSAFFGIDAGSYPATGSVDGVSTADSTLQTDVYTDSSGTAGLISSPSTRTPLVGESSFVQIHYKPNNAQYAQQGGVSASARLLRLKYNSITTNTMKYRTSYGASVGNAMAYGVQSGAYTAKDRIGFQSKITPVFSKNSTVVSGSTYVRVRR
jgi:hypothetical protein